jgi:hypothetical protein
MNAITLDDRDPGVIYKGNWVQSGLSDDHNSTTTYTESGGSMALVTFEGEVY